MALALFDLDNTLLAGDSDYLWGSYLCEIGVVDADIYETENQRFYDEYRLGALDIQEFLAFSLEPLANNLMADLLLWREQFIALKIKPLISPQAIDLVEKHRKNGDTLVIVTATNAFVTAPIAQLFGIDALIATEPEIIDGRYTGAVAGIPSYKDGKVLRLERWLLEQQHDLHDSWFYSDSHNDLPLLQQVSHPVAVDPDDTLRQFAMRKHWPILSLHDQT